MCCIVPDNDMTGFGTNIDTYHCKGRDGKGDREREGEMKESERKGDEIERGKEMMRMNEKGDKGNENVITEKIVEKID